MPEVYLDHAATTPLDPGVLAAMQPAFAEGFGNASSVHGFGRKARVLLEEARETIARTLGISHEELVFTSGGTEADNAAVRGVFMRGNEKGRGHVIVSAVEHHAVLAPAERLQELGAKLTVVPVDNDGCVDPDAVRKALTPATCLVSVMHSNNEVGTLEPVEAIARIARDNGTVFHTDAVQSFGKIPLDLRATAADLVTVTAHKIYGPKGIGALIVRKGTPLAPDLIGGAQELNRRAGTENVPLAVGFAAAVRIAMDRMARDEAVQRSLKDLLAREVARRFPEVIVNGHPSRSLPHILSVSFPWERFGLDGEALIMGLDLRGVAVTSGSACTSGTLQPSHVLLAMGREERTARATVRFSLGRSTTEADLRFAVDALEEVVRTARGR